MIRIAIADDHRLLLEGLTQALGAVPDLEVVGAAQDGVELAELVRDTAPDVLLVALEMPRLDGLAALALIANAPPAIVVTMHADEQHRADAQTAGAVGFLSKATPLPDLAAAVRAAAAGESFIDADHDVTSTLDAHRDAVLDPGAAALTKRERELLALLAAGLSATDELAEEMFISQKTVKNHLANIYEKLGVSDRAQAAVEAIRLGLGPS